MKKNIYYESDTKYNQDLNHLIFWACFLYNLNLWHIN